MDHHSWLAGLLESGDAVVSLNYDTLMDKALLGCGWNPAVGYGFSAGHKTKFLDGLKTTGTPRNVLLLKPHGSLNWFAKGTILNYEEVLSKRPPSKILMARVPRAYDISREKLVRFFVPPLYSKFFANRFWKSLWDRLFRCLIEAEVFIIIGCSLIEADFHLRAIIGRALRKRRRKFQRIIIVERSPEVRAKLRHFLRGQGLHGFRTFSTFTEFVKAGAG